ncbi:MAG: D-cysteine desulfhydrase family protein [Gemmatimonadetes bacterium]|nr:D-cysteine desulfhydrase family protein [Gemmatimonadota bacterium]
MSIRTFRWSRLLALPLLTGVIACAPGAPRAPRDPGPRSNLAPNAVARVLSQRFDRAQLAHLPTPLEEMETLSADLGGPTILIKRDDQTGLATGGNKARKLEYILADAQAKEADVVITWGGLQSNWCRQTAAGAAMLGMRAVLLLSKRDEGEVVVDGNHLLDEILGAEIHLLEPGSDPATVAEEIAASERAGGRRPYIVSVGGSRTGGSMDQPLGAMGYITAFLETHRQAMDRGAEPDYLVMATGSGGTQAGLVVGAAAIGAKTKIVGISVSGSAESIRENVANIATQTSAALGLNLAFQPDDIIVFDDYVGEGYGMLTAGTVDAIKKVARSEGILLDPVYTGKAMSGLIGLVEAGFFREEDTVVFVHTGGTPGIFHYGEALLTWMGRGQ